jgi:tetratricopeptide (TPR) repeat protein
LETKDKNIENNFLKALMYLDRNKTDRAKTILNKILEISKENDNKLYYVKINTVLGELNYNEGNTEIAKRHLLDAININYDNGYGDILDYEIQLCKNILNKIT